MVLAFPRVDGYTYDNLGRRILLDHLIGHDEVLADRLPLDRLALGDRDTGPEEQGFVGALAEGDQAIALEVGLELELGDLSFKQTERVGRMRGGDVDIHGVTLSARAPE